MLALWSIHYSQFKAAETCITVGYRIWMPANAWYWLRLCVFVIHFDVLAQCLCPRLEKGKAGWGPSFFRPKLLWGKASIKDRGGGVGGGVEMVIRELNGSYCRPDAVSETKTSLRGMQVFSRLLYKRSLCHPQSNEIVSPSIITATAIWFHAAHCLKSFPRNSRAQ